MKAVLKPGAELDILTQGEIEESLKAILSGFNQPPRKVRDLAAFVLDSSGNSTIPGQVAGAAHNVPVYTAEQGFSFELKRLIVQVEGYNAGTPYTGPGYVNLVRSGRVVDFANLANGLPLVFSYGSDAPLFNNGETVELYIVGGPASKTILADVEGWLTTTAPVDFAV